MAPTHQQAIQALQALLTTDLSPKQRCHVQWTLAAMRGDETRVKAVQ